MTIVATRARREGDDSGLVPRSLGLSGRLIVLTMSFVMLVQVLVYVPSAITFLRAWLNDKVMGAQMIALALTSTPADARSAEFENRLLAGVQGAQAIAIRGPGTRWLLANAGDQPPAARRQIDFRTRSWWRALGGLNRLLFEAPQSPVSVIGPGMPGVQGVEWVELLVDEEPLKRALLNYTRTFFIASLIVSASTGALLYLALHLLVVRPVRRLSTNISEFAGNPEDASRVIRPSGRTDEIGRAEEALARMEIALAGELRQKRHLAELGLAVSKINHELRNMLTTAQLLGDRLGEVQDATVRRIAPRLVRTLARAIEFCGATLAYGRASEPPPRRRLVSLRPLVEDQVHLTALAEGIAVAIRIRVPDELRIDADPDHLARVLLNLIRNSVEAMSRAKTADATIEISGERRNGSVTCRVADNGPGVPDRVRGRLFSAFLASERSGGTGLGLPVAEELVRLHGGTIVLEDGPPAGATFVVTIPDSLAGGGSNGSARA